MNEFKKSIWNSLYYSGDPISAELEASASNLRHWIAIYKIKEADFIDNKYTVLEFELDKDLVDEYFGDEDKQNQKRYYVKDEDELIALLNKLEVPLNLFTHPWKCDYPL